MKDENWDLVIESNNYHSIDIKNLWYYKDLLILFVKRDFTTVYKQTILGPLWFFIQPIFTTIIFAFVFGNIAKISTNGVPQIIFYMSGIVLWNFFSDCLIKTSETFIVNQILFGKVYFPRILVPLSIVINNFLKLLIQLTLFIILWAYYFFEGYDLSLSSVTFLIPIIFFFVTLLGIGFGTLISALTTKYRDLRFLIQFAVQLLMYASPIVYPLSIVSANFRKIILLNPMTSILETFKFGLTGTGFLDWYWFAYSLFFCVLIFVIGLVMFNKLEKSFIDTV